MAVVAGVDWSTNPVTGSFTGAGAGASRRCEAPFNASVSGTFVGTVVPQRSFDGGVTWNNLTADAYGAALSWTAPGEWVIDAGEQGLLFRLNCTACTSGTINWRLSR